MVRFLEDLIDRQAADVAHSQIDWKYLLSLDLGDPEFSFSVLSKFLSRIIHRDSETTIARLVVRTVQT